MGTAARHLDIAAPLNANRPMTTTILSLLSAETTRRYTEAGFWRDETIYAVARAHAASAPDRIALRDRHRALTYAELVAAADALAADLTKSGIHRGQRVMVWLPSRIDAAVAFLACSRNGLVVCLSPHRSHTVAEIAHFAERLRAAALLYETGFGADAKGDEIADAIRDLPSMRKVYRFAPYASGEPNPLASLQGDDGAGTPNDDPNIVMYIMFTSGSTGQPKGVMHSDNTLLASARAIARDWRLGPQTVTYGLSPISHSLGVGGFLTSLCAGGEYVMHDLPRGMSLIDRLVECGATYLVGVPTHAIDLVEEMRRRDMSSGIGKVMGFRISGAAAPTSTVAELLQRGVMPQRGYGMTEVNSHQYTRPEDDPQLIVETSGQSCPEYDLRIFSTDNGDVEATRGQIGQIGGRGASLMLGYFDDQIATENAFNAGGWFITGDLGWLDENGYLRVTGRKKDVIIRGGHNINPARIEDLAMQQTGIERAAALPIADPRLGERICLAVQFRADQPIEAREILAQLAQAGLSKYEMPEFLLALPDLPLMPNGKVQKAELLQGLRDGRLVPTPVQ
jgi:acyl-CoA synthetase